MLAELHETAAEWFAERERPDKALEHVTLTGENRTMVDLLCRHGATVLLAGDDHGAVRRALESVGDDTVRQLPTLALISALEHTQAGEHAEAEADLASCWATWPDRPDADLLRLRQLVLATRTLAGGRQPGVESLDWPVVIAALDGGDLEAWARLAHGWKLLRAGLIAKSRAELATAARLARQQGFDYVAMHSMSALAMLSCRDGAFPAAESACAAAVELAYGHGWTLSPWLCGDHVMLGVARLLALDPDAALDEARHAAAALPANSEAHLLRYLIDLLTGAALIDAGRRQDGLALLARARHDHGDAGIPTPIIAAGALFEHRVTLDLGHDALAQQLVAWTRDRIGTVAELALMHAWTFFAHGALAATEAAVREVLDDPRPPLCPTTRLEARLLETALEIRLGRRTRARGALDAALELAEPSSLVRPFHHADPSVRRLLLEQVGGFGRTNAFASRVSQLVSTMDAETPDVLTSREHAVLVRLSSPQSLDELASDMSVSVNTVKTHVRAIYAKLGVNNRRAAVVAGRQLGLS
jgi:LuxR family maltose regulon positive regulatory protein